MKKTYSRVQKGDVEQVRDEDESTQPVVDVDMFFDIVSLYTSDELIKKICLLPFMFPGLFITFEWRDGTGSYSLCHKREFITIAEDNSMHTHEIKDSYNAIPYITESYKVISPIASEGHFRDTITPLILDEMRMREVITEILQNHPEVTIKFHREFENGLLFEASDTDA